MVGQRGLCRPSSVSYSSTRETNAIMEWLGGASFDCTDLQYKFLGPQMFNRDNCGPYLHAPLKLHVTTQITCFVLNKGGKP